MQQGPRVAEWVLLGWHREQAVKEPQSSKGSPANLAPATVLWGECGWNKGLELGSELPCINCSLPSWRKDLRNKQVSFKEIPFYCLHHILVRTTKIYLLGPKYSSCLRSLLAYL